MLIGSDIKPYLDPHTHMYAYAYVGYIIMCVLFQRVGFICLSREGSTEWEDS